MAKKATKKSKIVTSKTPSTPKSSSGNFLTRLLFRPRFLLYLAVLCSLALLLPKLKNLLPEVTQRAEYRLRTAEIEITKPPRWIPGDFIKQVVEFAELPEEMSLLDDAVTKKIDRAFRRHPWVAEVVAVRKSIPARIEVELIYRRPVAMVRVKQGMYPVDVEGILLPPADFSVAETGLYPAIENVQSTPEGPSGTSWGDEAVSGAARLAEILAPHWKKFNLVAIRIPSRTTDNTTIDNLIFELTTAGGSQIIWGRGPGSDYPGELSAEKKIGRLEKYRSKFGQFDHPHGPYEIDIRHWQEISRRPLTLRPTQQRR